MTEQTNGNFLSSDVNSMRERYPDAFGRSTFSRLTLAFSMAVPFLLIGFGLWWLGFSFTKLFDGFNRLGIVLSSMWPPSPGPLFNVYLKALGETLAIAFLGTLLGAIAAFPLGFIAAKNVVANRVVRFIARRSFDTVRGIDTLIWALIFINVVGLGPFAGVLAIAMSDAATFGKLFSEAIEGADKKPVEGVVAAGGSQMHSIRFGMIPQVLPVILSQVLYYFESNTRSATIIGIVGAGGIGLYLSNEISQLNWDRVAFLILIILITVAVIDWISSWARAAIAGSNRP